MVSRRNLKRSANRGFTLIEMLVTIGVMAILTAGLVSLIGPSSRRFARDARRQTDLQTIASALAMYRNDKGFYPECGAGGTATCIVNTTNLTGVVGATLYLQAFPTDPAAGGRYYRYTPMTSAGGACDNPGTRCARFSLCATSEKDTTTDNAASCGGAGVVCGTTQKCVFVERNP